MAEAAVLHRLGLVRSDDLPDLAARWLASDVADTESVRLLAGHDPHDPWGVDHLLVDALSEAELGVPSDPTAVQQIALEWVSATWQQSRDTRWAVSTLAYLGLTHLGELDLGLFIGLDDEWVGGWGRGVPELRREAELELQRHAGAEGR
jgi:hypothetical protein